MRASSRRQRRRRRLLWLRRCWRRRASGSPIGVVVPSPACDSGSLDSTLFDPVLFFYPCFPFAFPSLELPLPSLLSSSPSLAFRLHGPRLLRAVAFYLAPGSCPFTRPARASRQQHTDATLSRPSIYAPLLEPTATYTPPKFFCVLNSGPLFHLTKLAACCE